MTIMEAAPHIKEMVSSRQVVMHYGFKPNRGGYICCPFHGEKTASLKIHKQGWYCYGCHKGGDAIDFIREMERCGFGPAVAKADLYFGLDLLKTERVSPHELYNRCRDKQEERKANNALNALKMAFEARLEKDNAEVWSVYRAAYSTPASARTANQWWDITVAEDLMEYIDNYQAMAAKEKSADSLSDLMARYEKGVNRDAAGRVIQPRA